MKKNKMMRLASSLLVAVLLTTSVISGTFAKYVTSEKAEDSARVAKWGVTVNVTGNEAFKPSYNEKGTETVKSSTTVTVGDVTTDENVLAPGTDGKLGSVAISGTPEVDVTIEVDATITLSGWTIDHDNDPETNEIFYCPLVFTKTGAEPVDGKTFSSAAALTAAVEALMEKTGSNEANNSISGYDAEVKWEWVYETNNDTYDKYDTLLGNKAANSTAPAIKCEIEATVEQVD